MDFSNCKNCPEKRLLDERIDKMEKIQNMKDEEQERAINGLTTTMDNFMRETKHEINELKEDIKQLKEELPNIFQKELQKSLDGFISNSFKKMLKWFSTLFVASLAFIFKSNIITFLKNLFK